MHSPVDVDPDVLPADQLARHLVERRVLPNLLPHPRQVEDLRVAAGPEAAMEAPAGLKLLQASLGQRCLGYRPEEALPIFVDLDVERVIRIEWKAERPHGVTCSNP